MILAVGFRQSKHWRVRPAADTKILPQLEPRAASQQFIMPSIRSRDVACAEWPDIRCFEHFLKLLDFVNNAFNVHSPNSIANQLCSPKTR